MSYIIKDYTKSELDTINKIKSYDSLKNKSTFYVIKPTIDRISGYKLGKSNSTASRIKEYNTYYDGNVNIKKLIQLKKRDTNIHQGSQPNDNFETEVKRQLKKNDVDVLRGSEWYKKIGDIDNAVEQVKSSLKPSKNIPIRRSPRKTTFTKPKLNDNIVVNFDKLGFFDGVVLKKINKGFDVYFEKDNKTASMSLNKTSYDKGTWKYKN